MSACRGPEPDPGTARCEEHRHGFCELQNAPDRSVPKLPSPSSWSLIARNNCKANRGGPPDSGGKASSPSLEGYSMPVLTFATRIRWTGSESSNTTNPKLGSFPPTPLVFMRSSTTFPKPGRTGGKSHVTEKHCQQSHPCTRSRQHPQRFGPQRIGPK